MSIMIANNVAFLHTHVLSDGQIVQHAHPFSKNKAENQNPGHSHNALEILVLNQLSILVLFVASVGLIISRFSTQVNYVARIFHVCVESHAIPALRAPPQFINA
jgi:hypothetical protein